MRHSMKLNSSPFEKIKDGRKTLELRLHDEKRRQISVGDTLEFRRLPELDEVIITRVTGLIIYARFDELIADLPASFLGYDESDKAYLSRSMYEFYSEEDEARYGVLGIKLELT